MTITDSDSKNTPLILVADDDRATRTLLKVAMEEEGYQVIATKNGDECLAEYKRRPPDMVLLDGMMPEMDGFTCCQRLRQLPGGDSIPVLMITALDDQDSIDKAFAAGAIDYITKPIHWAVLSQRVKRLLTNSQTSLQLQTLHQQLRQQQQWLQLLGAIAKQLAQPFELESLLKDTLSRVRMIKQVEKVIFSQPQGAIYLESILPGYPESASCAPIRLESIYGQESPDKIIYFDDLEKAELPENLRGLLRQTESKSLLIMPIIRQNVLLGLLSVHHCQKPHLWQSWEVEQFEHLADLLLLALS